MDEKKPDPRYRALLLALRQALLICLAALDDYLDLSRTRKPKRKKPPET